MLYGGLECLVSKGVALIELAFEVAFLPQQLAETIQLWATVIPPERSVLDGIIESSARNSQVLFMLAATLFHLLLYLVDALLPGLLDLALTLLSASFGLHCDGLVLPTVFETVAMGVESCSRPYLFLLFVDNFSQFLDICIDILRLRRVLRLNIVIALTLRLRLGGLLRLGGCHC